MTELATFLEHNDIPEKQRKDCEAFAAPQANDEPGANGLASRIPAFVAAVGAWLVMLIVCGGLTVYLVIIKASPDPYGPFAFIGAGAIGVAWLLSIKRKGVFFKHLAIAVSLAGHWLLASGLAKDGIGGSPMGAAVAMGLLIFLLSARFSHFLHQIVTAGLFAVMLVMAMIQKSPEMTVGIVYCVMFIGAARFLVYPSGKVDRRPMALAFVLSAIMCDVMLQFNGSAAGNIVDFYNMHSPALRGFAFIYAVFLSWPNLAALPRGKVVVIAAFGVLGFLPLGGPALLLLALGWRTGWPVLCWAGVLVLLRALADFYIHAPVTDLVRPAMPLVVGGLCFVAYYTLFVHKVAEETPRITGKGEPT